jgi:hypothetical protein
MILWRMERVYRNPHITRDDEFGYYRNGNGIQVLVNRHLFRAQPDQP